MILFSLWACSATDTGNPVVKGGYTDETETFATGIIKDSFGNPVPECSVWVHALATPSTTLLTRVQVLADSSQNSHVHVTDSSGKFAFIGLPLGQYSLIAVQKELGIGVKTRFTIQDHDTLTLLDTTTLLRVEKLTIPLDGLIGDTIAIPELGLEYPVSTDTLRIMDIPKGVYAVFNKSEGNTPLATLTTETISVGPKLDWNTEQTQATFTDSRDNYIYKAITIGNLVWMADNLRFQTPSSSCNPNDPLAATSCASYGRFYSIEEAHTVCPPNWHLPTEEEWMGLLDSVGGRVVAGQALKSYSGWNDQAGGNGVDLIGFSVLPAGSMTSSNLGTEAYFWTASAPTGLPTVINFTAGSPSAIVAGYYGTDQLSVRCVSPMK